MSIILISFVLVMKCLRVTSPFLPTEVVNLPTETGPGGVIPPHPLAPCLLTVNVQHRNIENEVKVEDCESRGLCN